MMTSSNGNIFRVTGPLCGVFTGPGEFPTQRPVTQSFDVFFDLRLNKRLSKQSWGWWFETLSSSLWRHCNDLAPYWQRSIQQETIKSMKLIYAFQFITSQINKIKFTMSFFRQCYPDSNSMGMSNYLHPNSNKVIYRNILQLTRRLYCRGMCQIL